MPNPWLSLWMSAANSWAGAARGFWSAEMQRQQTAMLKDMTEQMLSVLDGRLDDAVLNRLVQDPPLIPFGAFIRLWIRSTP